jgi:hypothetical protein
MGLFDSPDPPEPPPVQPDPEPPKKKDKQTQKAGEKQRRREARRQGRGNTVLTSPGDDEGPQPLGRSGRKKGAGERGSLLGG